MQRLPEAFHDVTIFTSMLGGRKRKAISCMQLMPRAVNSHSIIYSWQADRQSVKDIQVRPYNKDFD